MLLLLLALIFNFVVFSHCVSSSNVRVDELLMGEVKNVTISKQWEYILKVDSLTCKLLQTPPRISVLCADCEEESPLLVTVRQRKGILSWEMPIIEDSSSPKIVRSTARTMCPYDVLLSNSYCEVTNNGTSEFSINLSTSSSKIITAEVKLELEKEFVISLGSPKNITILPASPRYFLFNFEETNASSVLLHVSSRSQICMTVSIQRKECPVNDDVSNVKLTGYFQSVTTKSGFTIQKSEYPHGLFVVFVTHSSDNSCGGLNSSLTDFSNEPMKDVFIIIEERIQSTHYVVVILSTIAVFFALSLIIIVVVVFYFRSLPYHNPDESDIKASSENSSESALPPLDEKSTEHYVKEVDETDEKETDYLPRSIEPDNVCDLARKSVAKMARKSKLYLWYLITVSLFYFLPVVQLVITYHQMIYKAGDQNVCYFNFLCAHPFESSVGGISDFNHVFSNIGYVVMGVLFIGIVKYRQLIHLKTVRGRENIFKKYGIPQHFGLCYAMGTSLIVEGVFSACYHVCPNSHNFQFDTSFMYVLSALSMLKIYHTRHSDISASACAFFASLAVVILFGMLGVLTGTPTFWIIFTICHLMACLFLSIHVYYEGNWKFDVGAHFEELTSNIRSRQYRAILPVRFRRFGLILLANGINWALAGLGPYYMFDDFASYLLVIFMVNLIVYAAFYIIMKTVIYNEKIGLFPWILIVITFISWSASLYFFMAVSVSWKFSAAESKELNTKCNLLGFYDNHDIWHFLSATSVFLSFMVLLTVDDAVLNVNNEEGLKIF